MEIEFIRENNKGKEMLKATEGFLSLIRNTGQII
jgi:hypothetical protein